MIKIDVPDSNGSVKVYGIDVIVTGRDGYQHGPSASVVLPGYVDYLNRNRWMSALPAVARSLGIEITSEYGSEEEALDAARHIANTLANRTAILATQARNIFREHGLYFP
mgnify:CR=1 FL=1